VNLARYFWFSLSILLGLLLGLFLGTRFLPLPYENIPMNALRPDYKTDYVLMVAEAYHADHDLQQAQNLLQRLGPEAAPYQVQQAMVKARELNYFSQDVDWMNQLLEELQRIAPTPTPGGAP
jgi:hypothetical protein